MPVSAGHSGNALASLRSIDNWIETLNAQVNGAPRTAYKSQNLSFGGGTTTLERPTGLGYGIKYTELAMSVGSTTTDFAEGEIVSSTESTHIALSGSKNAFFLLADQINDGNGTFANGTNFYLTRDGEFHLNQDGFLVNANGLYVVGRHVDGSLAPGAAATTPGNPTAEGNVIRMDPQATIDPISGAPDIELFIKNMIDSHNSSIAAAGNTAEFEHVIIQDLGLLRYSGYGSTVYEAGATTANNQAYTAVTLPGSVQTLSLQTAEDVGTLSETVFINERSLEASNVQLASSMVELSLAQKTYSGITKIIQLDHQKIDNLLTLIR